MLTPKYLGDGTSFKVVLWTEYDDYIAFLVLRVTCRTV